MSDLYFGGLFPAPGGSIEIPGVAAELALSTVTDSGALDFAILRARVVGPSAIQASLTCDAADVGEVRIEEDATNVDIHVLDNATTVAELAALVNADSALIEMVGTWNPSDIVQFADDQFTSTPLTGGTGASIEENNGYWDGHFPFSVEATPEVPPATPEGVATFALRLEGGTKVTYSWSTDVFKAYDGKETRACLLDDPRESYEGSAFLGSAFALETRVAIAQHAALGAVFSLGLPYEETTIGEVSGAVVPLGTPTARLDWAVKGQRVLIHRGASDDTDIATGVIQDVDTNSITLDAAPDAEAAVESAEIMPLVPVLLEPEQAFPRYRTDCERWNLQARGAKFGFPAAAIAGELTMLWASPAVEITFRAVTPGVNVGLAFESGGTGITLSMTPGDDGDFNLFIEAENGTTLAELAAELEGLIGIDGEYEGDETLSGTDEFSLTALAGADRGGPAAQGASATVTELFDRVLWDRDLENASTMTDSVHSMTEILEMGGLPTGVVEATVPDWGRHIAYTGRSHDDWQWFKAWMYAVRGRWKAFYLPTMRADLVATEDAGVDELTISATTGAYDLWAARGYDTIAIKQGDATAYAQITGAVNNGDGTITLSLDGSGWAEAAVDRVSWCEVVHLESDEIAVTWNGPLNFSVAMTARAVQQ